MGCYVIRFTPNKVIREEIAYIKKGSTTTMDGICTWTSDIEDALKFEYVYTAYQFLEQSKAQTLGTLQYVSDRNA